VNAAYIHNYVTLLNYCTRVTIQYTGSNTVNPSQQLKRD